MKPCEVSDLVQRGQTWVWKHERTDDTSDDRERLDTRQALIDQAWSPVFTFMETDKKYVVYQAPEVLKVMNFLSDKIVWDKTHL